MFKQAALFHAIKPLFANKPLLVVVNKTDVVALDALSAEDRATLDEMAAEAARASGAPFDQMQGLWINGCNGKSMKHFVFTLSWL